MLNFEKGGGGLLANSKQDGGEGRQWTRKDKNKAESEYWDEVNIEGRVSLTLQIDKIDFLKIGTWRSFGPTILLTY